MLASFPANSGRHYVGVLGSVGLVVHEQEVNFAGCHLLEFPHI